MLKNIKIFKGVSAILFNTDNGKYIKPYLNDYYEIIPVEYDLLIENNYCLREKTKKYANRDD